MKIFPRAVGSVRPLNSHSLGSEMMAITSVVCPPCCRRLRDSDSSMAVSITPDNLLLASSFRGEGAFRRARHLARSPLPSLGGTEVHQQLAVDGNGTIGRPPTWVYRYINTSWRAARCIIACGIARYSDAQIR